MMKTSMAIVSLVILTVAVVSSRAEARSFDSEAISQVSKGIAEGILMNEEKKQKQSNQTIYVSSSLSGMVQRSQGEGVSVVTGLTGFKDSDAMQELSEKGIEAAYSTPSTISPFNVYIPGEQMTIQKSDTYHGYWYPGRWSDPVRYNAGTDYKIYIINTKYKDISWYDPRYPVKLGNEWQIAGGITRIEGKLSTWGIGEWVLYNRPMEASKYLPHNATLPQIIKLDQAFRNEDNMKIQFDRIRGSYPSQDLLFSISKIPTYSTYSIPKIPTYTPRIPSSSIYPPPRILFSIKNPLTIYTPSVPKIPTYTTPRIPSSVGKY